MSYYSPIVAALVCLSMMAGILISRLGSKVQDVPNERSLHFLPIPRTGGLGLMTGVLAGWSVMLDALTWWLLLPLIGIFAISLLDDIYNLSVKKRFTVHFAAAAIVVVGSGLLFEEGMLIAICVLLLTVWMTNLYNFMDGSNGLAGGMGFFGFGVYGVAALIRHNEPLALLDFSICSASLAFLYYNFHPARIFMGDSGSITLGFAAAAFGLWGWQLGCWPAWFPALVFSPFIVDASITLFKRSLRGVKVTVAHREHYYQRVIQMGWSHRQLALVEYLLMLGCGLSALYALERGFALPIFLAWGAIYGMLMLLVDMAWRKFEGAACLK